MRCLTLEDVMGLLSELDEIAGTLRWMASEGGCGEPRDYVLQLLAGRLEAIAEMIDGSEVARRALAEETPRSPDSAGRDG